MEATSEYVRGCNKEGKVYVIPAFETICGGPSYADRAALMDKVALQGVVKENCVTQFREKVAPACHNVTDFSRWFALGSAAGTQRGAGAAYEVQYKDEFEPWFVSSRRDTLWFDVRFRGYGGSWVQRVRISKERQT